MGPQISQMNADGGYGGWRPPGWTAAKELRNAEVGLSYATGRLKEVPWLDWRERRRLRKLIRQRRLRIADLRRRVILEEENV